MGRHGIRQEVRPEEIYNLAAQSHVQVSFETPEYTANADAKLYAYWITANYREACGMHASNGILFNHESLVRGETFVTRKVTRAVAAIHHGLQDKLYLGNLSAMRDCGHARDYAEGMWRIVQQPKADDYVLATGEAHTVREFVEHAFGQVGMVIEWDGEGLDERGYDRKSGRELISIDPRYFRPTEVDMLLGNPAKAHAILGWKHTTNFETLVSKRVQADLLKVARQAARDDPNS